ncbi:MAG: PDC sensor domain-containing protein [Candidatus Thiodiazotropha sp. (ex Ustalcina ferruginea)]|nr:PDC sensor domain-containing protein [Candidatus Thiodiazotropha sp. (ex Ustalcina ferruginea)]
MDEILSDNPVFIAYGLATTSGDLVITSSNLNPKTLPNILHNPQSEESFRKALLRDNLTLGRTYYYEPLEDWIIPLRYAVRNKEGVPVAVVTTAISLTSKHNP